MLSRIFTTDDTTLYPTWQKGEGENRPHVILFVPGVGEVRMSPEKAKQVSLDINQQADFALWDEMEKREKESHEKVH